MAQGFTTPLPIPLPVAMGGTGLTLIPSPTQQVFITGSGTYTTPAGVKWLRVRLVGAGAGGQGNSLGGGLTAGATDGGNTTFGLGIAGGGKTPVTINYSAGLGGVVSGGITGASTIIAIQGGTGGGGQQNNGTGVIGQVCGGQGGGSVFGSGGGSALNTAGTNGVPYGSGGAGAGVAAHAGNVSGGGGGAGGYLECIVQTPLASYSYAVGAGGTGGTGASVTPFNGGNGANGLIIVEEFYI